MEALVTGGAQGIGYQIVESLINDGFSVTIFDINPETLNKAKSSFGTGKALVYLGSSFLSNDASFSGLKDSTAPDP